MRKFNFDFNPRVKDVIINPFFMYGIAFMGSIFCYLLYWADYPQVKTSILIFLLATVLFSVLLGFVKMPSFDCKKYSLDYDRLWFFSVCLVVFLALSVAITLTYAGKIPLLKILFPDEAYDYMNDFRPIRYFTLLVTSLINALVVVFSFLLLRYKETRYIYLIIVNYLLLALFGSRGLLMVAFLPTVVIFLYMVKYSLRKFLLVIVLIVSMMYLFGVYGDLREGVKTHTDYSLYESVHSDNYPRFLSPKFMWVYYYYTSPIVKFHYVLEDEVFSSIEPDYTSLFFIEMIPYSIARRLYPEYDDYIRVSEYGFASYYVGTAYDDVFLYAKWKGVILYLLYFFSFLLLTTYVAKRYFSIFYYPIIATVVTFSVLSVFDNMLCFSPLMFELFWIYVLAFVVLRLFTQKDKA